MKPIVALYGLRHRQCTHFTVGHGNPATTSTLMSHNGECQGIAAQCCACPTQPPRVRTGSFRRMPNAAAARPPAAAARRAAARRGTGPAERDAGEGGRTGRERLGLGHSKRGESVSQLRACQLHRRRELDRTGQCQLAARREVKPASGETQLDLFECEVQCARPGRTLSGPPAELQPTQHEAHRACGQRVTMPVQATVN